MKIIATTGFCYIAELTQGDIAALVGQSYFGTSIDEIAKAFNVSPGRDFNGGINLVGATIDLSGRFDRVTDLESRFRDLLKTAAGLRVIADLIDKLGDQPLSLPPKPEGAQ